MLIYRWSQDKQRRLVPKSFVSADPHRCDSAERKMYHHNHGCAFGTIVSSIREDRKRKAQEDGGGDSL